MATFIIYVDDPIMALDLSEIVTLHMQHARVLLPQSRHELTETISQPEPSICVITKSDVVTDFSQTIVDLNRQRPFPHISIGRDSPLENGITLEVAAPSDVIVDALKRLGLPAKPESAD